MELINSKRSLAVLNALTNGCDTIDKILSRIREDEGVVITSSSVHVAFQILRNAGYKIKKETKYTLIKENDEQNN
jgi:hypothetical protein